MIHFVVALLPEAKPLIEHYDLKPVSGPHPFKIYTGKNTHLVISGIGKTKALEAAQYLQTFSGNKRNQIWINIGIAGHAEYALGEAVLAHKITDEASSKNWFPPLVFKAPCKTGSVLTVNKPQKDYGDSHVYEMEAAGFYEAATCFSTAELIHSFKVISDNRHSSQKITPEFTEQWIRKNLNCLDGLVKNLVQLSEHLPKELVSEEEFQKFIVRWHFTVSQKHRLRNLLRRLKTLEPTKEIWTEVQLLSTSKLVLHFLENQIHSTPVFL